MKTFLFLLLALLLTASACKKDSPEAGLPPATQRGANTGGCLINGERFVAMGWGGSLLSNPIPPLGGGFFYDSLYSLRINGVYQNQNTTLTLFFRSQALGTHYLNQNTLSLDQGGLRIETLNHATLMASGPSELYITNSRNTGIIILSYANKTNGISAGTFEFTAASQADPAKTITITHGRFDRKQ
ncbi:DUF6252 family protein [Hymenobacter psychrotolerans]|uniref:DUF4397 domain-containing protein n=1 Tax=Hymenobacter psychrotolerans DSM 18569 TaxID=1121959 RepID=A0A1M7HGS0_9BACT|nr:DUF6252 family protein [Hymenobacter psychrotolerans]SHM27654.1 hypothetical protein SAMN02746009_04228 [Hymenobacter psychrotolerans DSM 18569]